MSFLDLYNKLDADINKPEETVQATTTPNNGEEIPF
jgi:hypothetical protein